MRKKPKGAWVLWLSVLGLLAGPGHAAHWTLERARQAIESGDVDPDRDIRPILRELDYANSPEDARDLVSAIVELGSPDAESPNSVKAYLLAEAPPVLLEVIQNGKDVFLRGDAVMAFRSLEAPRELMMRAVELAERDPDSYVRSRGELLRAAAERLPDEDPEQSIAPADRQAAAEAIAYLDKRRIAVSMQALRDAAQRADSDSVRALLAAGVPADTGVSVFAETPLYAAVTGGCREQGADTDWLLDTVRLLIDAGADVERTDDAANSALHHAAHWCGAKMAALLADAGVDRDAANGAGFSALALAFVFQKLDTVEALIDRGARLTPREKTSVEGMSTDQRFVALVQRASR